MEKTLESLHPLKWIKDHLLLSEPATNYQIIHEPASKVMTIRILDIEVPIKYTFKYDDNHEVMCKQFIHACNVCK